MNETRPPFYLITGLLLGLGLGLLISVVLFPAREGEGSPSQLNSADKNIYRGLAAQAFAVDNNLKRASARLSLLGDADAAKELAAEAQRMLAEGRPLADAEILARLASALQKDGPETAEPAAVDETGIPLFTPDPSLAAMTAVSNGGDVPLTAETVSPPAFTPRPTPSPAPTLGAPFGLSERRVICEPDREPGQIFVHAEDQGGKPVPGIRIEISWLEGQEFFFTGLIPAIDPGYADYTMAAGQEYALRVGEGGEQVRGISIPECTGADGSKFPGSIDLRFTQP